MRAIRAIFIKQLNDLPKNLSITTMFVAFPLMAFLLGALAGGSGEEGAEVAQAAMNIQFAMMFVAMTPMIMIANTIAEDNEYKSLRFLVMAGVKPAQYLAGLISFAVVLSLLPITAFAFMGGLSGQNFIIFVGLCTLGALVSSIVGALVGLFSKNVQSCSAISTPVGMIFALLPFLAGFNETLAHIATASFTGQIFMSLIYLVTEEAMSSFHSTPVSLAVIGANGLVAAILFAIAYSKKGLKG
ncbi:MAG: ABC transporter permease [Defluviitaleaceae bacterium]|nr:ABC transporter permease [Defluviitaleaceae bacterium]